MDGRKRLSGILIFNYLKIVYSKIDDLKIVRYVWTRFICRAKITPKKNNNQTNIALKNENKRS